MQKLAFKISDNSIQASSSYAGPSVTSASSSKTMEAEAKMAADTISFIVLTVVSHTFLSLMLIG